MARKSKSGGGLVLGALILAIGFLANIPKDVWVVIGILVGVSGIVYVIGTVLASPKTKTVTSEQIKATQPVGGVRRPSTLGESVRVSRLSDEVPLVQPAPARSAGFRIPTAPNAFGSMRWIPAAESIEVANTTISGGMIYVGTARTTDAGHSDPCLIDPSLPVAARGDYTERGTGYWPSYSSISSSARRAYLNWLADGRRDPEADVGYLFLFFYGLERRVLVEASHDPAAKAELPLIAAELNRLLGIYGAKSGSFQRYAGELLNWIELSGNPEKLYAKPIPQLARTYELPVYLRLALGQAAVDGVPVSPPLALAWVRHDPGIALRTPARRCAPQFDALFKQKYAENFGDGLVLARNRTKLKFAYRPASSAFHGQEMKLNFGELPDVSAVTGPTKKLQQLADTVTTELDAFSRLVGKTPDAADSLDALSLLPTALWPAQAKAAVAAFKTRVAGDTLLIPFQELLSALGGGSAFNRNRLQALVKALESEHIGFEPDVLAGARTPKTESAVVLFELPPGAAHARTTTAYQAALLTLDLASAVAAADGEFSAKEIGHLDEQIQGWTHLTRDHRRRLRAHLRLLSAEPMRLAALKKRLEPLSQADKETIGAFMATVAQVDGTVSPDEVKLLEKLYKALGIDVQKVFSDLHAVAAGDATPARAKTAAEIGFTLDAARIAALQQDTRKVAALLSSIFTETEEEAAPAIEPEPTNEDAPRSTSILGLDEAHSALARLLLSRPEWSRAELDDAAADLDLMLDGALEALNEAAFDAHDIPFTEGDDPIEVGAEIVEKLAA
jgi:uncharacterized tellurite resistance protein B-like protein